MNINNFENHINKTIRETYGFVSEMEELLEKARDTDDIILALDIAFLLFNEAIDMQMIRF